MTTFNKHECAFCGSTIPSGASICAGCGAFIGKRGDSGDSYGKLVLIGLCLLGGGLLKLFVIGSEDLWGTVIALAALAGGAFHFKLAQDCLKPTWLRRN
jgi:hypothetical protein